MLHASNENLFFSFYRENFYVLVLLFYNVLSFFVLQEKAVHLPTITTPSGSAKPESVANLNACHLLKNNTNQPVNSFITQIIFNLFT